jgi:hypothetical protein
MLYCIHLLEMFKINILFFFKLTLFIELHSIKFKKQIDFFLTLLPDEIRLFAFHIFLLYKEHNAKKINNIKIIRPECCV